MRKLFALAMVAMLSLIIALAVVSCSQQQAETTPPAETTTPAETTMPADTGGMGESMEQMGQDTTAQAH